MPYKDKQKQIEWQVQWMRKRRENWLLENGPCAKCSLCINLEVDHIDPSEKEDHRIWSWSKERRDRELEKCQVLCHECHKEKTASEQRKIGPEGMEWCTGCQKFLTVDSFHKNLSRWNGLHHHCKKCRKKLGF